MPLVDFMWEDSPEEVDGIGLCFVAIARDSRTNKLFNVAIPVVELEEFANRKALKNEQRQH